MSDEAHRNTARRDSRPADDATATEPPVVIITVTAMKCATVLALARMLFGGGAGAPNGSPGVNSFANINADAASAIADGLKYYGVEAAKYYCGAACVVATFTASFMIGRWARSGKDRSSKDG